MLRNIVKMFVVILSVISVVGCSSSGSSGVSVRRYVQEKERVDQQVEGGNSGFLMGTPKPEDRSGFKKTRKVYVVEFSAESKEQEENSEIKEGEYDQRKSYSAEVPFYHQLDQKKSVIDFRNMFDEEKEGASINRSGGKTLEYKVEKDDTLQKISKKFYDSYKKWPQIYEMNKEVIKDPNRIKPGITIRIPPLD